MSYPIKILFFLAISSGLFAIDISMLTEDKQEAIRQKERSIDAGEVRGKYDWIGSFSLGASITESSQNQKSGTLRTEQASVNFNQDLFRSGGIIGSVTNAKERAKQARLMLEKEVFGYLSNLATLRLNYEIDSLRVKQNEKQLKNSEITLFIKKRQYEVGIADVTQLNDAIRDKNSISKQRVDLINTKANRAAEISKLSPLLPEAIALPSYKVVEKDLFVNDNFSVLLARSEQGVARSEKVLTRSNYLPTLSANAKYGWQKTEGRDDDDFYSYGLSLTMPLKFTSFSAVEEKKAEELRAFSALQSAIDDAGTVHKQTLDLIRTKEDAISLLNENIKLYDELITITRHSVMVGEKSRFDLEMLENSREIDAMEIRINELLLEIEKAKLFYMVSVKRGVK